MAAEEKIRTAFERNQKALSLRPSIGHGTAVTTVRVRDGLTCDIEEGAWKLVADMAEKNGGSGVGPTPGTYGRGALGSCLAIGYMMWASRLGVPFGSLEVQIQADYDAAAEYGVTNGSPSYSQIRYLVTIESTAPEADIVRVLDTAEAHSTYHDIFHRSQDLRREVRISPPRS
jgi:uncharacterized OsmC-like protein